MYAHVATVNEEEIMDLGGRGGTWEELSVGKRGTGVM